MRKKLFCVLLTVLIGGLWLVAAAQASEVTDELDALWAKRGGSGQTGRQGLALAEKAFAEQPGYDIAWRASRACFWICDRTENGKIDSEFGLKGKQWGEKAVELNPNGVEGHYFLTICLGEYGKGIGIARALFRGVGGQFEKHGEKAVAINAAYDNAGPLRGMGRYWQKLPALKRDLDKAAQYYKRAVTTAPCMIRTYFYLLEVYIDEEKWDDARATAQQGLNVPGCPGQAWESNHYRQKIQALTPQIPAP
ncbi:MAG: hypothetical protein P9L99_18630 [Candidatus Lernaella stagnicola]|nr:hypothetical protein [Candidatus Lernaella stagnicola]